MLTFLKDLFNSYIGSQRPFLAANSVARMQRYLNNQVEKSWATHQIAAWYSEKVFSHENPLEHLARIHIDSIIEWSPGLPEPFDYDRDRFKALHLDYRSLCAEMAISSTIAFVVDNISWESQSTCRGLSERVLGAATRRVMNVDPSLSFWTLSPNDPNSSFLAITLEIARTASIERRKRSTPHHEDIERAQTRLLTLMGHNAPVFRYLACMPAQLATRKPQSPRGEGDVSSPQCLATRCVWALRTQIQDLVNRELARIRDMSEVEIFYSYVASKPISTFATSTRTLKLQAGLGLRTLENHGLAIKKPLEVDVPREPEQFLDGSKQIRILAQRIAHMVIIHWRVWEPLLRS